MTLAKINLHCIFKMRFGDFKIFFRLCSLFTIFTPKNVCLHPLKYIIKLSKKLLLKLRFEDLGIFFRFYSLSIIFPPQKLPKNHHTFLKMFPKIELWRFSNIFNVMLTFFNFSARKTTKKSSHLSEKSVASGKFILLFKIHDKIFDKILS